MKEIKTIKEIEVTQYKSNDGLIFDNYDDCYNYETEQSLQKSNIIFLNREGNTSDYEDSEYVYIPSKNDFISLEQYLHSQDYMAIEKFDNFPLLLNSSNQDVSFLLKYINNGELKIL